MGDSPPHKPEAQAKETSFFACASGLYRIRLATIMSLHNCRVVLVRPRIAANLGATARVMRNMGLAQLVLVAPEADPNDREARRLSTHAEAILDQARIVEEFGAAVADCVLVIGTSARIGGPVRRQSVALPEDIL